MLMQNDVVSVEDVRAELPTVVRQAKAVAESIKDKATWDAAAVFLVDVKRFRKKIEDTFEPVVKKAHDAWKAACKLRNDVESPLDQAERQIKGAMARWYDEQERKRKEEEARIAAEMKKQEDDSRLNQAADLEAAGDKEAAEAVLSAPSVPATVTLEKPKTDGIGMRKRWRAEVIDKMALIKAVAEGKAPAAMLEPNAAKLNELARAMNDTMNIPGVRAVCETDVSARVA
ncbi:MAG: hypothetical protein HY548_00135 [Elusimicrobia bacterium]|nr:hypothetical protein [Elusimicrobiota bacterium]